MSCFRIYYNENKAKCMAPVNSAEEYRKLRHTLSQINLVSKARKGEPVTDSKGNLVEAKSQLKQMNYSCLPNEDGSLKDSKRLSRSVGMDIDIHRKDFGSDEQWAAKLEEVAQTVLQKKEELQLLMLERSAGSRDKNGLPKGGFHLVFKRRPELSQEENLKWASQLLGVEYDSAAKDITRVFFTTTGSEEDLLYLSEELFDNDEQLTIHNSRANREQSQACLNSAEVPPRINEVNSELREQSQACLNSAEVPPRINEVNCELKYHGLPYADIIQKYWELYNFGKLPAEGDRNVKTFELAKMLRHICDYNVQTLERIIPRYDGFPEEEWRQTIINAVNEERKGMPYQLRQVLTELKKERKFRATGGTKDTPPRRPKKLPRLLMLLTSKVPEMYKDAVAEAVFPALGIHLHGVKFLYTDNVEHEPTFMHVLIAQQSIGKGRIKEPIDCINADIMLRDEPNRLREAEWKRKNPAAKSKPKDPRPQDICIQLVIDNLTDAVFNQRVVDAHRNGERFIYTIVDEVEGLRKVTSSGKTEDVSVLIRKAFDNAKHGQERVGADAMTGIAPLRWNWNASSTPPNAVRFFSKAVNDGTLSRLNISTILKPEKREGEKNHAPVVGFYDDEFKEALKPYLTRLDTASGLVVCPKATQLALQLQEELDELADLYESEAYRILSYRAIVIGFLKAMVLYVADGMRWSREIADYVRWSVQMDLWCKMRFFGAQLEEQLDMEVKILNACPKDMLSLLGNDFTEEEYCLMRQQQGKQGDGRSTLRSWKLRGYVDFDEESRRWFKTEKYFAKTYTGNGNL